jgi:carbon storage regulator
VLVLRRRAGESILIGDDIEIALLEVTPQTVKIGIKAPKNVTILRKELRVVEEQNRVAARELDLDRLTDSLDFLR